MARGPDSDGLSVLVSRRFLRDPSRRNTADVLVLARPTVDGIDRGSCCDQRLVESQDFKRGAVMLRPLPCVVPTRIDSTVTSEFPPARPPRPLVSLSRVIRRQRRSDGLQIFPVIGATGRADDSQ